MTTFSTELQTSIKEVHTKAPCFIKAGLTYLTKQSFRQSIRFMPQHLPFHKHLLSVDGKSTRAQTRSAFRHYYKTGYCRLYVDEQDGHVANLHAKDVSKIRNLRDFSIQFRKCPGLNNQGIIVMAKSLGIMKGLKSIKIIFQGGDVVYDSAVQRLVRSISQCTTLEKLELKFIVCPNITDRALTDLKSLKRLSYLKSLILHLNWANNITANGIQKIEELLRGGHLKKLEVFDLSLIATASRETESLQALATSIGHLAFYENLRVVKLNFKRWTQTDFGLLAQGLEKLKGIRALDLNFEWCDNFENVDLRRICYSIRELTSLKYLSLNFGECQKVSDIEDIENMLYNLKGLNSFSLDLGSLISVHDSAVEVIGRGLGALNSLKSAYLNFQRCWDITDEGTSKLLEGIASNTGLEELNLQFDWQKNLGKPTFISLKDSLINLKKLKMLTLGFQWCNSITDDSVEPLSEFFAESTGLEKLSLNFSNCHDIGDLAIEKLCKGLKNLVNLSTLSLNFAFCENTSSKAMHSLKPVLLRMPLLKILLLNFDWSFSLDDNGILELAYALQHFQALNRLHLSLSWINNITDEALRYICQAVLKLKQISMADFYFVSCQKISEEARAEFKNNLKRYSKIDLLYFNFDQFV